MHTAYQELRLRHKLFITNSLRCHAGAENTPQLFREWELGVSFLGLLVMLLQRNQNYIAHFAKTGTMIASVVHMTRATFKIVVAFLCGTAAGEPQPSR
jgi:hypothetical protein